MYQRYADSQGWKYTAENISPLENGGIKEAVLQVNGKMVYSKLKYEGGVHRVQRVPATESSGRVHTSTATVAVMPEVDEVAVEINPKVGACRSTDFLFLLQGSVHYVEL